jgi:iron complex outermembrane receptor protein
MSSRSRALKGALLVGAAFCARPALAEDEAAPHTVSSVVVQGEAPAPEQKPLATRDIGAEEIAATVNATTVEDALRYLPNVFVRRRHIGDTQAPITTRTSGVGASARSLVYADGVLLSALIGNNNSTASPRWGMVSPAEIDRIEVRYGPFSAAFPGNSIGAVVNITTRTPDAFEAEARLTYAFQPFSQYATKEANPTYEAQALIGDRTGPLAWRVSWDRIETRGQPLSYMTSATPAATSNAGVPVTGAFLDRNRTGAPIAVVGAGGLERQQVDNGKLKLDWDVTPRLGVGYLLGYFANHDDAGAQTYLRDAQGAPVYSGAVNIGGRAYALPASLFANGVYALRERHWMQALTLTGEPSKDLRWQAVASLYDYGTDEQRAPTDALPGALKGGAGSVLDLSGTGWRTFDAQATWTPSDTHSLTVGGHYDRYVLGQYRYNTTDWIGGPRGALAASSRGATEAGALFVEDTLRLSPDLRLTAGLRAEHWRAYDGLNYSLSPALNVRQPKLDASRVSPKAVLAWSPAQDWRVTASFGEAYRFPTVSELYQAVTVRGLPAVPNPNLAPERAISSELSAQRTWKTVTLRLSGFTEDVDDALISQTAPVGADPTALASFVQNVGHVRSRGVEAVVDARDVWVTGLDLSASATWVDSEITRDAAFPAAVGKQTPQVPRLRWTAVATWKATDRLTLTAAARYSDRVYATIDNSDLIGHTYQGFEGYFLVDARAVWQVDRHWSAAIGVDNATNDKYFLFHPFPQRSVLAELRYAY